MNDCLGRELLVGDIVVWPYQYAAHSVGMRSGQVRAVLENGLRVWPTDHLDTSRWRAKTVFLTKVENVVKVGPGPVELP
jgi:hypothetical protein